MKPRKPEPKDYTFVGNTPNVGQAPDLLVKLRETHPTVYKMLAHQKNVQTKLARHAYLFGGLRTIMQTDAYDLGGVLIAPYGSYLAMYVHNLDMDAYNQRYADGMSTRGAVR